MPKLYKILMWYALGMGAAAGVKSFFKKPEPTTEEVYAAHLRERGYAVEEPREDESDLILYLALGFCIGLVVLLVIFL
jgi:hypothetical protein